ncbi:putative ras-specific guanine nucleotide-releasing factor 2-like, partial [Triplophysa rosa]
MGCRSGALDLSTATSSAAGSPTSTYNPLVSSPPPTCTKAPLDLSRGPGSPELAPSAPEEGGELPRIDAFCGKLRRSIRRGQSPDSSRCSVSPASAFAIATAAAGHGSPQGFGNSEKTYDKEFLIRRAASNRVLNVLRHWVSKHSQ